ncbi:acyl carrier protein [Candidatus Woesearchaeota archaeon]|jgi:acyl carrier protein|nr:acyl carrier protein [Candidatus Woesearchaeota archaeon]
MSDALDKRIKNVMSAIFDIAENQINKDSSPDTIESWDSLKHMNLVVALEEEFGFEFADEEIVEMMNYNIIQENISLALSKK